MAFDGERAPKPSRRVPPRAPEGQAGGMPSSLPAARLQALIRLIRTITASLDAETILRAVTDAAVSLFPGGACRLWVVEGNRARLRAETGTIAADSGPVDVALGEGLAGSVCQRGQPAILEDVTADARAA